MSVLGAMDVIRGAGCEFARRWFSDEALLPNCLRQWSGVSLKKTPNCRCDLLPG